ncbi:MAG: hypothetical protein M3P45_10390 [Acidobacteriota bacterium]|nr:hypothetical protein [Acidobacteriota bacterium]
METGADVNWISTTGKLVGCKFGGDWWVRAVPMFGTSDSFHNSEPVDGYVASNGNFWLVLNPNGIRYTMIIGKGKNPIKSIGFDAITGKNTNLGLVDLKRLCP